jgi:glycosyltransferase involved in cell wall biosynthesis
MFFSIITPSFRQLDWLGLCATSIADQGVELEHLVQDAGSPGIEDWAKSHPSVQVKVESDHGMYDAINRGLKQTKGDICAYLNCDEQYLPGTLRRIGEYFDQHPEVDIVFGDAILADASLQPLAYRRVVTPQRWHTRLRPLGVLTCSLFFRRKVITLPEAMAVFAFTGSNLSHLQASSEERHRWQQKSPPGMALATPLVEAWHILRKWRAGAYQGHPLNTAWFTPYSVPLRQDFRGLTLDWKWPSVSSLSTP